MGYGGQPVPLACKEGLQDIPYYYRVGSGYPEDYEDGFLVGKPQYIMYFRPDGRYSTATGRLGPWANTAVGQSLPDLDGFKAGRWYVGRTCVNSDKVTDPNPHSAPKSAKVFIGTPLKDSWRYNPGDWGSYAEDGDYAVTISRQKFR